MKFGVRVGLLLLICLELTRPLGSVRAYRQGKNDVQRSEADTSVPVVQLSPWNLITALAWSPDGERLALAAGDYILVYRTRDWLPQMAQRVRALTPTLAFSPDGTWLAAGSRDGQVRIWSGRTLTETLPTSAELHFNTTGPLSVTAIGSQPVLHWNAHKKGVNSVVYSPDGGWLTSGGNDAVARLWQVDDVARLAAGQAADKAPRLFAEMIGGTFAVSSIAFAPDNQRLAIVNGNQIRIRSIQDGRILGTLRGTAPLYSLAISPDGNMLAAGDSENMISLWDPSQAFRTGLEKYPQPVSLVGHHGKPGTFTALIWRVIFSPDGHWLASAGGDGTVRIWETATGRLVQTFEGHTAAVSCLAFSPDGARLASGSLDGTLRLWQVPGPGS